MEERLEHRPAISELPGDAYGSIMSFLRVVCEIHSMPVSTPPLLGDGGIVPPMVLGVATLTCGDASEPLPCRECTAVIAGRRRLRGFSDFSGPHPHWHQHIATRAYQRSPETRLVSHPPPCRRPCSVRTRAAPRHTLRVGRGMSGSRYVNVGAGSRLVVGPWWMGEGGGGGRLTRARNDDWGIG